MIEKRDKILCRNPDPAKQGTNIDRWKYDAIRKAILAAVGRGKQGLLFKDLNNAVAERLTDDERRQLGSIGWFTVTVKLHLEAIGEIERVPGTSPHRIVRKRQRNDREMASN